MNLMIKEKYNLEDFKLEIFNIKGKIFEEYSNVIMGYMFHFTLGNDSIESSQTSTLSLKFHWSYKIIDSLENLKIKIDMIKDKLLEINNLSEGIDQFAYINLFIIEENNQYKLVISSDTFDISKLLKLE